MQGYGVMQPYFFLDTSFISEIHFIKEYYKPQVEISFKPSLLINFITKVTHNYL